MQNQINSLVVLYKVERSDIAFGELYDALVSKRMVTSLARVYNLHESEVTEIVDDKLLEMIEKFDGLGSFKNFFSRGVKNACIDFRRKLKRKYEHEESFDSSHYDRREGERVSNEHKLNTVTAETYDKEATLHCIQKSLDQHQLIEALMVNASEDTRQSVQAFANSDSLRKAAKLLGVTDKTVKSRLRKLSALYDANRFGDIYDYFTVATEPA